MELQQGVSIIGICKGFRVEQFNNQDQYFVGFDIQGVDHYNEPTSDLEEVSIFGDELEELKKQAALNKGKLCVMPVVKRSLKSAAGNAYMRTTLARGAKITPINPDK